MLFWVHAPLPFENSTWLKFKNLRATVVVVDFMKTQQQQHEKNWKRRRGAKLLYIDKLKRIIIFEGSTLQNINKNR